MDETQIKKLRRFALLIGLFTFIYLIAKIELETFAKFKPQGIPLMDLLGLGLFLALLYSTIKYLYYALSIKSSPKAKRNKIFKDFSDDLAKITLKGIYYNKFGDEIWSDFDYRFLIYPLSKKTKYIFDFFYSDDANKMFQKYKDLFHKYFPGVGKQQVIILYNYNQGTSLTIIIPKIVKISWILNDIDYYSPIWVNLIAIVTFIIFIL